MDKFEQHIKRMRGLREVYEVGTGQHNILSILINECEEALRQPSVSGSVTKLIQTRLKTETQRGNCYPTVIACLLGYDSPEKVIQFQELYDREDVLWTDVLNDWLEEKGFELVYFSEHQFDNSIYMVSGKTERETSHVCLYQNGKLWHDPHPSQSGLISETLFSTIRSLTDR